MKQLRTTWIHRITPNALGVTLAMLGIIGLTVLYRFFQPVTHPALLQFDVFDWMIRSKDILVNGRMTIPTTLWVFPQFNAWLAQFVRIDLFDIYLYSGAALTTLNLILVIAISRIVWPRQHLPTIFATLLYGISAFLLTRSVNYLPEAMTYTFGLGLLYCYLWMFSRRSWKVIPIILLINYFYFHLHQSGLNFILFSVMALFAYMLWLMPGSLARRLLSLGGVIAVMVGIVAIAPSLREQFLFFLRGSKNADVAFQGTPIPLTNFLYDFPAPIVVGMIVGTLIILKRAWSSLPRATKLSELLLIGIPMFYFLFLYVFPNLHLYNLIPWRFYTWFSLYALFVTTQGLYSVINVLQSKRKTLVLILAMVIMVLIHGNLISDDMYTADRSTLTSMATALAGKTGTVFTTNANYLQTRYASFGQALTILQTDSSVFHAPSGSIAAENILHRQATQPVYVLISKYQLQQRPSSIAYWENSAFYNMNLAAFREGQYFTTLFEDDNILLVSINPETTLAAKR